MEAPPGARLVDGWWTWEPTLEPLRAVQLTRSSYARDYRLCWDTRCATLSELAGPTEEGEAVTVAACSAPAR